MRNISLKKNIKVIDFVIFMIPLLSFSFILYIFFPGIFNFDVFEQLRQINSNDFSNAHPFISTFYIMIFHKFIGIRCSLPIFQILWFSILWTKICKYNRKVKAKKYVYILQILVTIFVSFNPMISTTVISNNKDSLFFLIFLTICYKLQIILDKRFNTSYLNYVSFSFLLIFFMNVRYNGYYTCLVFIPIIIVLVFFNTFRKNKKILMTLLISLLFFEILFKIPIKVYNVKENKATSGSVAQLKALQFDGYLLQEDLLDKKEKDKLSKFVSLDSLLKNNNYTFTDNLVLTEKTDYYEKHKDEFVNFSVFLLKNHLIDGFRFYHISSTLVWDIVANRNSVYNCLWYHIDVPNRPKNYYYVNEEKNSFSLVYDSFSKSQINRFARVFLYSPSVCMYLSFIILLFLMIKYKYKDIWLLFVFNFINVLIISFSIPVQDTRYLLNNFGCFYMLIIIFINQTAICYNNKKTK